jgi:branched-chain amino acid transport system permease protein
MTMSTRSLITRALTIGVIAGLACIYLAAIGIVERFQPRNVVTGVLTLGLLVPAIVIVISGYRAALPKRKGALVRLSPPLTLLAGAVAGIAAGAVFGLFVLIASTVELRWVFANISPRLVSILSHDLPEMGAALVYLPAGALLGLVGAGFVMLPALVRRPLAAALIGVILVSLMEPMLRVALLQLGMRGAASFLYQARGLTIPGAALAFVIVGGVSYLRMTQGGPVAARYRALPVPQRRGIGIGGLVLLVAFLVILPQLIGAFLSEVVGTVGLFVLMGLGLNIVVGFAGLLDLGFVAFFAIGAYATALLTSPASVLDLNMSFWLALPIVMAIAATFGILIGAPVLRLRGDYLAIVTLGFGEIVRFLLLSDALRPWLGGAQGILGIPAPGLGISRHPQSLYYPILAFCILGAFVAASLANSRLGRAWNAMREDEEVAQATGINTTQVKLLAFAIGAVFGGVAGSFLAVKVGSVFPQRLDILISITTLSLIILGGMGSIPGVVVGAFVLVGLPELLREFAEYRLLIYGAVLVGMMILRPEGLIPNRQRRRELHEQEQPEEQFEKRAGGGDARPVVAGD